MELEEAIKDIEVWLEFPVWFIHTGKDEDFLRRIDIEAIETILKELEKKDKILTIMYSFFDEHRIDDIIASIIYEETGKECCCQRNIKQYFEKKAEE